jgi:transposase InsO family protein
MSSEHSIDELCRAFEVSRSGYYDWSKRREEPGPRALEDAALRPQITAIHQEHEGTYGSPRIHRELAHTGLRHGRNRIARLMRELGLSGQQGARFKVVTTNSNHDLPIAPNRLRQAVATRPNQIWVGDITYIKTAQGWLYLAAIMDLYSRRIVGWGMSERIDTALVLMAWQMAQEHRQPPGELIFHSDRGVQYASAHYRRALQAQGALPSMSRRACCYDNAAMESFWSTLKRELVYRRDFLTHEEARREIFAYIETRYNRKRLHSSLDYLSPIDFENQLN